MVVDHGPASGGYKRGEASCKAYSRSFTFKGKGRSLDLTLYQEAHERIHITLGNNEGAQKFQVVIIATQHVLEASASCYTQTQRQAQHCSPLKEEAG